MKLADCFTFYNELDMLEFRLAELDDVAKYFVLVEATKTFAGNDKPLYFNENKSRYEKYLHKIIHVVVDDFPETTNPWVREKFQRNAIRRGVYPITDDIDTLTICDVDEIPDSDTLTSRNIDKPYSLHMDFYYYNFTCKSDVPWHLAKVLPVSNYASKTAEDVRHTVCSLMEKGGWHLSYFGDPSFIANKIKNFSHQEYNSEGYTNLSVIQKRMDMGIDIYGRSNVSFQKVNGNAYLPKKYTLYCSLFGART